jgi:hypothetical protein
MTRMANKYERADHDRDNRKHDPRPGDLDKRILHVSYLTAYLDTLLRMGAIPEEYRSGIRATVDNTRAAFALPDLGPRERADA